MVSNENVFGLTGRITMSISRYLFLTLFFVVSSTVAGQQERSQPSSISSPVVTAASSAELARFTAPGNITQIRLEIFSSTGERVFDSGPRQGRRNRKEDL